MKNINSKRHLLILGYVWPEPASSAAGRRVMQLISLFQACDWRVTFASSAAENKFTANLEELGIDTEKIEVNNSAFDNFVREVDPAVVLFDRFVVEEQFGWRVAEACANAVRVLDTEDLHCLRKARGKAVREGRCFTERDLLKEEITKREIASILRSDLTLIISEAEYALLQKLFGIKQELLFYLPFIIPPVDEKMKADWPSFQSRSHFVTVGNFRHAPNRDAVAFLKNDIWPLIRKMLPGVQMHVYGAYPGTEVQKLNAPENGFYIHGRVEDVRRVVKNARVCLAPLRFGAGLKGKLTEAMRCGTPSVTTTIGAEGIPGSFDWSGRIADKPEDISAAAVELYTDKELWEKAQKNGERIINNRFRPDSFIEEFSERLDMLQEILVSHREQNFTGSMLMHHTAASTKYMSKWIEAKNS